MSKISLTKNNKPQIKVLSAVSNAKNQSAKQLSPHKPSLPGSSEKRVLQARKLQAQVMARPQAVIRNATVKALKKTSPRLAAALNVSNGFGGTSKGTKMKYSKKMEINGDGAIDKRLKKASVWYSSLRDPIQGAGARLPDAVGINTATMQCVQITTVPTNAQGMNGLYLTSPFITATNELVFQGISTASTPAAVAWGGVGAVMDYNHAADTLREVAQSLRPVSAAIFAEYEGATLADQGEVTAFVGPYRNLGGSDAQGGFSEQDYPAYQTNYGSSSCPVNKARSQPMVAYYFPCSLNTWEYTEFVSPTNEEYSQTPQLGDTACSPFWSMGFILQGLGNTPSVKYTSVINYEFIPRFNVMNYVASSPSPIDETEEALVESWVQMDTQTGLSSNKKVDVQPGSQKTEEAVQGFSASNAFGMLGSVVKEIMPLLALI